MGVESGPARKTPEPSALVKYWGNSLHLVLAV